MVESDKVLLTVHGGDESWMLAVTGNMSELNAIRGRESLGIADIAFLMGCLLLRTTIMKPARVTGAVCN